MSRDTEEMLKNQFDFLKSLQRSVHGIRLYHIFAATLLTLYAEHCVVPFVEEHPDERVLRCTFQTDLIFHHKSRLDDLPNRKPPIPLPFPLSSQLVHPKKTLLRWQTGPIRWDSFGPPSTRLTTAFMSPLKHLTRQVNPFFLSDILPFSHLAHGLPSRLSLLCSFPHSHLIRLHALTSAQAGFGP